MAIYLSAQHFNSHYQASKKTIPKMPEEYMSMLKSLPSEVDKVKEPVVGVATVDVGVQTGPPRHLASGILYGIPDKPDQIPDHFYKAIGFNYGRGGGSQLPGTKGYAVSLADYEVNYPRAFFICGLT